jgi:hypothetical protein
MVALLAFSGIARAQAERMRPLLGQPVIIEMLAAQHEA